jgi:hypothetical protein
MMDCRKGGAVESELQAIATAVAKTRIPMDQPALFIDERLTVSL